MSLYFSELYTKNCHKQYNFDQTEMYFQLCYIKHSGDL